MASILDIRKGDIIVERANGKKSMTPVRHVEFNACSKRGVHVNRNLCYDSSAVIQLVQGEGTLGDLEDEIAEMEEAFDPGISVTVGEVLDKHEALAERLVRV